MRLLSTRNHTRGNLSLLLAIASVHALQGPNHFDDRADVLTSSRTTNEHFLPLAFFQYHNSRATAPKLRDNNVSRSTNVDTQRRRRAPRRARGRILCRGTDRAAGTWRFEQDDGSELEYDAAKCTWLPVVRYRLVARILAQGLIVFPFVLLRCAMGHAWMYSSTRTF